MEKVKFVYIGKKFEYRIPKSEFFALKLSKKDKQTLYPHLDEKEIKNTTILIPHTDEYLNKNEVFVQGIGWKKIGKTNKVVVPLFSGNVEDWDDYIEKYGKECLFYSLSGYSLHSYDCCVIPLIREFHSIMQCKGGIKQYQKFVENIEKIQQIQLDVFKEKLSFLSDWGLNDFIENHLFRPCYNVSFVSMPPYLDTIIDDVKLEEFYIKYRKHEIMSEYSDYDNIKASNLIYKEIGDGVVFPICMTDRMKMLFGEECEKLYQSILDNF